MMLEKLKIKLKKTSASLWSKSTTRRFTKENKFDINPGPKYKTKSIRSNKGPSFGPKYRYELEKRKEEQKEKIKKLKAKNALFTQQQRKIEQSLAKQKERELKEIQKELSQLDHSLKRSTWAGRDSKKIWRGKKLSKENYGKFTTFGPKYNIPSLNSWKPKYVSPFLQSEANRVWR